MMKKIGVVLSGCGVYDGSEIHEAVITLLALAKQGAEVICFAPDKNQAQPRFPWCWRSIRAPRYSRGHFFLASTQAFSTATSFCHSCFISSTQSPTLSSQAGKSGD